jgi:hypothetical protein
VPKLRWAREINMSSFTYALLNKQWRVYSAPFKPGMNIVEVQTIDGTVVVPWDGFDALDVSKTDKETIVRHLVKVHNEYLSRQESERFGR